MQSLAHKIRWQERYATDPVFRAEKVASAKASYAANREKKKEQSRKSQLKVKYGLTPEQYEVMERAQDGLCAICKRPPQASDPKKTRLCVDHDHSTQQVRSLLCHGCNVILGLADESPAVLYRAIEYLNFWKSVNTPQ